MIYIHILPIFVPVFWDANMQKGMIDVHQQMMPHHVLASVYTCIEVLSLKRMTSALHSHSLITLPLCAYDCVFVCHDMVCDNCRCEALLNAQSARHEKDARDQELAARWQPCTNLFMYSYRCIEIYLNLYMDALYLFGCTSNLQEFSKLSMFVMHPLMSHDLPYIESE